MRIYIYWLYRNFTSYFAPRFYLFLFYYHYYFFFYSLYLGIISYFCLKLLSHFDIDLVSGFAFLRGFNFSLTRLKRVWLGDRCIINFLVLASLQ